MNKIITIGREFGLGGRELARLIAQRLNFAYYDREIISEIAKRTSLSEQYVQNVAARYPLPDSHWQNFLGGHSRLRTERPEGTA